MDGAHPPVRLASSTPARVAQLRSEAAESPVSSQLSGRDEQEHRCVRQGTARVRWRTMTMQAQGNEMASLVHNLNEALHEGIRTLEEEHESNQGWLSRTFEEKRGLLCRCAPPGPPHVRTPLIFSALWDPDDAFPSAAAARRREAQRRAPPARRKTKARRRRSPAKCAGRRRAPLRGSRAEAQKTTVMTQERATRWSVRGEWPANGPGAPFEALTTPRCCFPLSLQPAQSRKARN